MSRTSTVLAAIVSLLPACGGEVASKAPDSSIVPEPRAVVSTLPPGDAAEVDALYDVAVVRTLGGPALERWEWRLWRRAGAIETRESRGDTGELWRRDAQGVLQGCDRLFHAERRLIELVPGDLAALDGLRDWDRIGSLLDPTLLGKSLLRTGTVEVIGRPAEVYEGGSGEAACSVEWIPSLRLPSRLRRARGTETIVIALREIHPAGKAPWPRPDVSEYRRTDYADIGDAPTDPFLRRFAHGHGPMHPGHEDR